MSILAALAKAYERLPNAPPAGFSSEKIGFLISLNDDGSVAGVTDLRDGDGKKKVARQMFVPAPTKRTMGIAPNFLWDKTSYVLGVTAGEGKRTAEEHAKFVERHLDAIESNPDTGLQALKVFLQSWTPERFSELGWPEEMKDQNIVFTLESERHSNIRIHDRPAARALWSRMNSAADTGQAICLVSGERAPVARLHQAIKGVWGAQSSGASIVSFNIDAFTSYGHEQGDNAPVSEAAAFAYTTALNRFLEKGSGHRLQIGDASTVYWADGSDAEKVKLAETMFAFICVDDRSGDEIVSIDEKAQAKKVEILLKQMRLGLKIRDFDPELAEGVRFYVLGLAPNAARLSIRMWLEDSFGVLAENYASYLRDIAFEPWPSNRRPPSIRTLVLRTAPARRDRNGKVSFASDDISPLLAGELLRSILTGARFPGALLGQLIMRIRSDHLLDSTRAALVKAILVRNLRSKGELPQDKETYLVRSDPDDPNPARRLGRLFALIERAQLAALGEDINTTVRDKFLGAAAATPLQVFVGLTKGAEQHHLKRLRNGHSDAKWIKDAETAKRVGNAIGRDIGRLWAGLSESLPAQHSVEEQGFFFVGYYQERFGGRSEAEESIGAEVESDIDSGEEAQ